MKRELEAKILEVDARQLTEKLLQLNARKTPERKVVSIFFDYPDSSLRKNKTILRLRSDNGKAFLCVKKKSRKGKFKDLDEIEVAVNSFGKTRKLLLELGFEERLGYEKRRTSFALPNATVELDKHSGVPYFAEIEADSGQKILEVAKKLGFREKQLLPWSTYDILKHYKKL